MYCLNIGKSNSRNTTTSRHCLEPLQIKVQFYRWLQVLFCLCKSSLLSVHLIQGVHIPSLNFCIKVKLTTKEQTIQDTQPNLLLKIYSLINITTPYKGFFMNVNSNFAIL